MLGKELPDQLAAAVYADLVKYRLQVILHGAGCNMKRRSDLCRRLPLCHELHDLTLTTRECIGLHDEPRDLHWSCHLEEMVGEENTVAERWTGRGTHQGAFQGAAPTGRQVMVPGVVFYRIAAGKIAEFRGQFDGVALMQQIGAIPIPS